MQLDKVWPKNKHHYLLCDELHWQPYISSSLLLISWAFNQGLIDEEPEYVIQRDATHISRLVQETDKRTVLRVLARIGKASLKEIATYMEADMACIGKSLGDLVKSGLAQRTQCAVMVDGRRRARWFYTTALSENEAVSCGDKRRHATRALAMESLANTKARHPLRPYQCDFCESWHIGRV